MRGLPKSLDGLSDAQAAPLVENRQDKTSLFLRLVQSVDGQVSTFFSSFLFFFF
jgi:hypothetical protein